MLLAVVAAVVVAPVTGGTTASDAAVVALVRGEQLVCTGTVIAPHVVLTAAHCVSPLPAVVLGDSIAGAPRHATVAAFVAPGFDEATLANDLALLVVADALPTPLAYATSLGASVGATIRVVGFGLASASDAAPPSRRAGTSRIESIDAALHSSPAPSLICEGDSGGPAIFQGVVVGVASSGDPACGVRATHTRVDLHAQLIGDVIARTAERSSAAGERCYFDAQCADAPCLPALDEPRISFCAPSCADAACASGLECVEAQCRNPLPSPGAEGAGCASNDECAGSLCLAPRDGDDAVCTQRCFSDLPGFRCPDAESCRQADDGAEACFAPTESGGCHATHGGGGLFVLGAIAAIGRRRRRARPR